MAATPFCVKFRLPFPPSVNALFLNRKQGGRAKTEKYEDWIRLARQFIIAYKADRAESTHPFETITTKVQVTYRYGEIDDNKRRDVENFAKAVSDLLVKENVLEDDQQIRRMTLEWASDLEEGIMDVYIENLR